MAGEVISYGPPEVTTFAAPVTFNEIFRLVQSTKFASLVTCMNTFHFGTETTGASESSLVADWRDNIVPTWKANVSGNITFQEVSAQRIVPQSAVASAALSGGGAVTGPASPCPTAGVITWRTQLIGRRRRGRTYVAGLPINSASDWGNLVNWGSANLTRLNNIGSVILTRYTLGGNPYGFQLICWSRTTAFEPNQIDWRLGASMVTRYTTQPYIATMGSRRGQRGI